MAILTILPDYKQGGFFAAEAVERTAACTFTSALTTSSNVVSDSCTLTSVARCNKRCPSVSEGSCTEKAKLFYMLTSAARCSEGVHQ